MQKIHAEGKKVYQGENLVATASSPEMAARMADLLTKAVSALNPAKGSKAELQDKLARAEAETQAVRERLEKEVEELEAKISVLRPESQAELRDQIYELKQELKDEMDLNLELEAQKEVIVSKATHESYCHAMGESNSQLFTCTCGIQ